MKQSNLLKTAFLLIVFICNSFIASAYSDEEILRAMRDEIKRSMSDLSIESIQKPYYIEYKLKIQHDNDSKASLGSILSSSKDKYASLSVGVRIGSYKFDNSNFFDFGLNFFGSGDDEEAFRNRNIPIELDYKTLRRELWLATDAAYKQSAEIFSKKEAALKNRNRRDTTHDYLQVKPERINFKKEIPAFNNDIYEKRISKLSEIFADYPEIHVSRVSYEYNPETVYYVNSEGREYIKTEFLTGLEVIAASQSEDGMPVAQMYSAYADTPDNLPTQDSLMKAVRIIAEKLRKLTKADYLEESYSGPVIFEGQAAAEIFAQVFAPNLVTQRAPMTESGFQDNERFTAFQTKIGGRVLPEFLSIKATPTMKKYKGYPIFGHFELDDEGVKPSDVNLVKDGYLKALLSSRVPTKRVRKTNGHNRGGAAMLSVIEISSNKKHQKTDKELKDRMLKLCKDRELPYGIIVRKVVNQNMLYTGLYNITKGDFPAPFGQTKKVLLEVYKVFPDGKEELIRGCQAKGFSVASFKDIIGVGKNKTVLNYLASAVSSPFVTGGSRYIPATVIVPNLLFEDGEIKPVDEDYPKPPFLSNPVK